MRALEVIASSPLILDNIFMWMDLFSLYRVRRVCKTWKSAIDAEITKRRTTSKVDCVTICVLSEEEQSVEDDVKIFKEKIDVWKRSWEATPTVLLVSPSCSFDLATQMTDNCFPDDCICVAIDGAQVCVDGKHTETEGYYNNTLLCCNLVAFHSVDKVSVLASKSKGDEDFFKDLHDILVDPALKLLVMLMHHGEIGQLLEKSDKVVEEAAKRGVVVLCYACDYSMVTNFRGHKNLASGLVAVSFKGQDISAASLFVAAAAGGGIKELVEYWEKIECARKMFVQSCADHKMSSMGFCLNCKSQTLGFLLSPTQHPQYGYEEEDDDPRPVCCNQEQDAFRFILPNIPLIGWLGDYFNTSSNVNVDAEPIKTDVLRPVDDSNFVFALLVLR